MRRRNQLSNNNDKGEKYADGETVGANTSPPLPEGS
jgi:hypothetical protein